jgi:hypothetical protein
MSLLRVKTKRNEIALNGRDFTRFWMTQPVNPWAPNVKYHHCLTTMSAFIPKVFDT